MLFLAANIPGEILQTPLDSGEIRGYRVEHLGRLELGYESRGSSPRWLRACGVTHVLTLLSVSNFRGLMNNNSSVK